MWLLLGYLGEIRVWIFFFSICERDVRVGGIRRSEKRSSIPDDLLMSQKIRLGFPCFAMPHDLSMLVIYVWNSCLDLWIAISWFHRRKTALECLDPKLDPVWTLPHHEILYQVRFLFWNRWLLYNLHVGSPIQMALQDHSFSVMSVSLGAVHSRNMVLLESL